MQEPKGDNRQGGLSWSTPAQSPMPTKAPEVKPSFGGKEAVTPKTQMAPTKQVSSQTKYVSMIVLGIVAGVVIAWGWSAMRSQNGSAPAADTNPSSTTSGNTQTSDTGSGSNVSSSFGLVISSPQVAGNSVAIAQATLSAPTWIVVYENNNGKPGNALGAGLFFPENKGGTVELLRGTTAGKSYLATEQVDNGDRKFSLRDDQFVTVDGAPQWVTFEVK